VAPDLTFWKVLAALMSLLPLSLALDDLGDLLVFFDIFVKPSSAFSALARCLSGESSREFSESSVARHRFP
jgi:hypothetical protein